MPVGNIASTKRGKGMVFAAIMAAATTGWTSWHQTHPAPTPAEIHQAIDHGVVPPAVELAIALIEPWEGLRTEAYLDAIGKPTVCVGETLFAGKPVRLGMHFSPEQCKALFVHRVTHDFYLPLVDKVKDFTSAPDSLQGAAISVAYNAGVGAVSKSRAAAKIGEHEWTGACAALTAFNKAGGHILPGLVKRREMGDSRVGEAEVCLSTEIKS
jgi:GH24 family phage-related lysozyme (muramidase)